MIDVDRPPLHRGLNSLVLPSDFPPSPDSPVFPCCPRLSPSPHFHSSNGRRMEWSPSQSAGSSDWAAQWLLVAIRRWVLHTSRRQSQLAPSARFRALVVVECVSSECWFGSFEVSADRVCTIRSHSTSPSSVSHSSNDTTRLDYTRTTQANGTSPRLGRFTPKQFQEVRPSHGFSTQ